MKKTITLMLAAFLTIAGIQAQSIQEGLNHLYADRDKSAKETFEKLVNTNPNNLDAVYWLGQSYIAMQNVTAAKDLYSKTLQANGNAPLILVGMGHVELINGDKDKARQLFESAITLSTGKKGADGAVLNAIGRAHVDAKTGDVVYAIEKLKLATEKDSKNADYFLNLGDAYRKAHDGSNAVINYDKAIMLNPTLARAAFRKAMIYYTQKNWDVYVQDLNKAISMDPKFAPAFYELYYYNLGKLDFNTAQDYANKFISTTEQDPQNDYLRIQTEWAKKNYDQAISGAKALIAAAGEQTKPRVYKLLADAYTAKGDAANGKQYIDQYFAKAKEEEIIPTDYILRGKIYSAATGNEDIVLESYVKAASLDSVYESKMKTLMEGADYFKGKGDKNKMGELGLVILKTKKNPNHFDLFNAGYNFYQGGNYKKADSIFTAYNAQYPDSIYGYYWGARSNIPLDSTFSVEPYLSKMIAGFSKTLQLAGVSKERFKSQAVVASNYLAVIYNNTKKNKDSAIYFLDKGLEIDPTNTALLELKEQLMKAPAKPPVKTNKTGKASTSSSLKPKTTKAPTVKK